MERNEPVKQQGKTVSALPDLMLTQEATPKGENLVFGKKEIGPIGLTPIYPAQL